MCGGARQLDPYPTRPNPLLLTLSSSASPTRSAGWSDWCLLLKETSPSSILDLIYNTSPDLASVIPSTSSASSSTHRDAFPTSHRRRRRLYVVLPLHMLSHPLLTMTSIRPERCPHAISCRRQRPCPRQARLLRRELDQSHLGHQRRVDPYASRCRHSRQRQAVLRRHAQVGAGQSPTGLDQGVDVQVGGGGRMAAGSVQSGSHFGISIRVGILKPST